MSGGKEGGGRRGGWKETIVGEKESAGRLHQCKSGVATCCSAFVVIVLPKKGKEKEEKEVGSYGEDRGGITRPWCHCPPSRYAVIKTSTTQLFSPEENKRKKKKKGKKKKKKNKKWGDCTGLIGEKRWDWAAPSHSSGSKPFRLFPFLFSKITGKKKKKKKKNTERRGGGERRDRKTSGMEWRPRWSKCSARIQHHCLLSTLIEDKPR